MARGGAIGFLMFLCLFAGSYCAITTPAIFQTGPDPYCGPYALERVFSHFKQPARMEDLIEAVYVPELGGSLISDLQHHGRSKGFLTAYEESSLENLVYYLSLKLPVVLLTRVGNRHHYYTVVDYDFAGRRFKLVDAAFPRGVYVDLEHLRDIWEPMDNQLLLFYPMGSKSVSPPGPEPSRSRAGMLLAHGAYKRACRLLSRNSGNRERFVHCLLRLRKRKQACAMLRAARESGEITNPENRMAMCELLAGRREAASVYARRVLRRHAVAPGALMVLAEIQEREKNSVAAIGLLRKALSGKPEREKAELHLRLALLYQARGQIKSARENLKDALGAARSEREALLVRARFHSGAPGADRDFFIAN